MVFDISFVFVKRLGWASSLAKVSFIHSVLYFNNLQVKSHFCFVESAGQRALQVSKLAQQWLGVGCSFVGFVLIACPHHVETKLDTNMAIKSC